MTSLNVDKEDLLWLQQKGFLRNDNNIDDVWKELNGRCSKSSQPSQNVTNGQASKVDIPPLSGSLKSKNSFDLCISYSLLNGSNIAKLLHEKLQKFVKVTFMQDINSSTFDPATIENNVANSMGLVVILTADSLKQPEIIFAMTAARFYYDTASMVILVHDAESCLFPGYEEQPVELLPFFAEKAVTYLQCYADVGASQILDKFFIEKTVLEKSHSKSARSVLEGLIHKYTPTEQIVGFPKLKLEAFKQALKDAVQFDSSEFLKSLSEDDINQIAKEADKSKDGTIDLIEFKNFDQWYLLAPLVQESSNQNDTPTQLKKSSEKNQPKKGAKRGNKKQQKEPEAQQQDTPVHEDVHTRVFLSHKRTTGQGIAGRLYEGLKQHYKVFLDSEATFKLHNLKTLVESTEVLIFILSPGILLSKWCLEEIKSAVRGNKQIIVVRDLSYKLPHDLPPEWKEVESAIRHAAELVWIAEYNQPCIDSLVQLIGPGDQTMKAGLAALTENKDTIISEIKSKGTLRLNDKMGQGLLGGVLWHLKEYHSLIKTMDFFKYTMTDVDIYPTLLKKSFPNLKPTALKFGDLKFGAKGNFGKMVSRLYAENLEFLEINRGYPVTDIDVQYITEKCHNLQNLCLWTCKRITDESLRFIAAGCPKIKTLNLSQCEEISNEGIHHISEGCPELESLNVSHCDKITDEAMEILEICDQLHSLDITGTKVTKQGKRNLSKVNNKLKLSQT